MGLRARRIRLALVGFCLALAATACDGLAVSTPTPAAGLAQGVRAAASGSAPVAAAVATTSAASTALPAPAAAATAAATAAPAGSSPTAPGALSGVLPGGVAPAPPGTAVASQSSPASALSGASPAPGPAAAASPAAAPAGAAASGAPAPAVPAPAAALAAATATPPDQAAGAVAPTPPPPAASSLGGPTPVSIGAPAATAGPAPPGQAAPSRIKLGIYGWDPDSALQRSALAQAGTGMAQIAIDWRRIELTESYNEQFANEPGGLPAHLARPFDARIRAAAEAGLQPVLLIVNPPDWALQTPVTQGPLKPEKTGRYVSFITRVVQRYAAPPYNARHVVLWPEPDHRGAAPSGCESTPYRRAWGDAPAQFATMLKQTYPSVKAARPDVQVIMGALAYDNWGGDNRPGFNGGRCGPFNFGFLDDVLANGGGDYFDVFAFNAYAIFSVGWEQNSTGYDVAAKTNYLRRKFPVLNSKPIMVLEAGVWSDPSVELPVLEGDRTTVSSVRPSADWQAAYPAKLLARGLSVGLLAVFWYGVQDTPEGVQRGLLDASGRGKKALDAYRYAVRELGSARFDSTLAPRAVTTGTPEGYVFTRPNGGKLAALWAVGPPGARSRVTVDLPGGNIRAVDAFGNALAGAQVSGATVSVEVTDAPVFLFSG